MNDRDQKIAAEINGVLVDAFTKIPDDGESTQITIGLLLSTVKTFAQLHGPELQQFWAGKIYEIADQLATGEPLTEKMRQYLETKS